MSETDLEPIIHASAWTASSLLDSADWLNKISPPEATVLRETLRSLPPDTPLDGNAASMCLGPLDDRLAAIRDSLENGCGATLVRGLDLHHYADEQTKLLFWLICQKIGFPVSQSATGETVFSVQDEGFKESDGRARGPNTRKRLSFHTDRCDVIAFLCVRPAAEGGDNDVISSVTLYNKIRERRPDLCRVLMQPFYYQRHNVDQGNDRLYCQQPIFSIFAGSFAANVLRVLIERAHAAPDVPDLTRLQREALDFLEETAEDNSLYHRFHLEPGDMLFLNNWVTFHRRTEFVDHQEVSRKRLLFRVWLSTPNSRPLHPAFAGNYGNTAAGAIRGGMKPVM